MINLFLPNFFLSIMNFLCMLTSAIVSFTSCISQGFHLQSFILPPTCSSLVFHRGSQEHITQDLCGSIFPVLTLMFVIQLLAFILIVNPDSFSSFPWEAVTTDIRITLSFSPSLISTFGYSFCFILRDLFMCFRFSSKPNVQNLLQSVHIPISNNSIICRSKQRGAVFVLT